MRQLSRTSDLLILSSLEGNSGQIHTAGGRWIAEGEKEGKQKMPFEGGGDVRRGYWRGEMEKGRSGRARCTGYNLNHMADLKKAASFSYNHNITAPGLFHVIKHVNNYFCFVQMQQLNRVEHISLPSVGQGRLWKRVAVVLQNNPQHFILLTVVWQRHAQNILRGMMFRVSNSIDD